MNSILQITAAVLLVALAGCGGSDRLETARVRGVVTLNGAPYTQGGTVFFQPDRSAKMATGKIQSDGSYELSTYTPGDGAVVGRHLVTVMPPVQGASEEAEGKPMTPVAAAAFPKKYSAATTSGLAFDVKSGESNNYPIELKTE